MEWNDRTHACDPTCYVNEMAKAIKVKKKKKTSIRGQCDYAFYTNIISLKFVLFSA